MMYYDNQISILFPEPGVWSKFRLTAFWQDVDGFSCRRDYSPADLTEEQREVLRGGVDSVSALDAPWKATHASIRMMHVEPALGSEASFAPYDVLEVVVHARRADGATRMFTSEQLPVLRSEDSAAIEFYKSLTQMV